MVTKGAGGLEWQRDALCAQPKNLDKQKFFFSANPDEKYEAKNLCFKCPVREQCIKWALENGEIWGIWGGRDENEIRRTLSVNAEGNETRRGRYPQCLYCGARTSRLVTKVIDLPDGGRWTTAKVVVCTVCNFEWRSRSSANAVNAYHAEREEKSIRAEKRRSAKKPGRRQSTPEGRNDPRPPLSEDQASTPFHVDPGTNPSPGQESEPGPRGVHQYPLS